jgi:phosphoglycerate dehydrogenase-like enzyme
VNGSPRFRIAVLDDYQRVATGAADWASLGGDVSVVPFHDHVGDHTSLVDRLEPFDGVVVMRERTAFPRRVLEGLPRLQILVTTGRANAAIDVDAAAELGVVVSGTEGWRGMTATVELTWGLILGVARSIPREDAVIRHGGWQEGIGTGLAGKTLGIVGLGNLGSLMPPIARAFGMSVCAWSRNLDVRRAAELMVEPLEHDAFFASSDVVTVHMKLSERSRAYLGRDELRLMKRSAYLVNTSRGPIVDEAALVEALRANGIRGAALDVYDEEPLPIDHPLRRLPNVLLSPHSGYVTRESYTEYFTQVVEDLAAFRAGAPIRLLTGGR